jgi:hypothetical protein
MGRVNFRERVNCKRRRRGSCTKGNWTRRGRCTREDWTRRGGCKRREDYMKRANFTGWRKYGTRRGKAAN